MNKGDYVLSLLLSIVLVLWFVIGIHSVITFWAGFRSVFGLFSFTVASLVFLFTLVSINIIVD